MPATRAGMTIRKPMIPRKMREWPPLKRRDMSRDEATGNTVLLDKTPASEADDPFATFSEWSNEADEKAYGGL